MKKTRIIIGCIFAAIAVGITMCVCVEWASIGCGVESLVMAILFYSSTLTGLWYTIDSAICGK